MKNILVFYGGKSCEHDVSIITGVLTLNSLDKNLFNPVPVYIHSDGEWYSGKELFDVTFYKNFNPKKLSKVTLLSNGKTLYKKGKIIKKLYEIYSAVNCMHGLNGEDGSLSGLLKLHNIPLASPDVFGSSLAIDKEFTKIALKGIGVKTLPYAVINKKAYLKNQEEVISDIESKLSYPIIIKPANLGSSIGVCCASDSKELKNRLKNAFIYDDKLLVEPRLENFIELNCGGYRCDEKTVISEVEKPVSLNEILTFKDKYEGFKGGGEREFPAKIPAKITSKVKAITKKVYESFGFSGIIRVDYLLKDGTLYLNEINTVPGSLAHYLFSETLSGFTDILTRLIENSVEQFNSYALRKFEYSSSVLDIKGGKGGKLKNN